jgi:autophagy-related protein 16
MEELYHKVLERNTLETTPFVSVHAANATLLNQIDALQSNLESLEREIVAQQQQLEEAGPSNGKGFTSNSAALKNETRLREKLEKLQEELSEKFKKNSEDQAFALKTAAELSEIKDLNIVQEATISNLKGENEREERAIEHLTTELTDAKSRTTLAEMQYVGLKKSIRILQEENDLVKKENRELEVRLVSEKTKMSSEVTVFSEMVDGLKREVVMLRTLKVQDEKRKSWFGQSAVGNEKVGESTKTNVEKGEIIGRKWGSLSVTLPSGPKQTIQAHTAEASCVR